MKPFSDIICNASRTQCSRWEAIDIGISAVITAHAFVCVVTVLLFLIVGGGPGLCFGFLVASLSWAGFVPVLLPVGYVCGVLAHWTFSNSTFSVVWTARMFAALFELNLLGWVVIGVLVFKN